MAENVNGGLTVTVNKSEFVIVNKQYYEMLGYKSKEDYELNVENKFACIHPDDRDRIIRQFETSDNGKRKYTMEYRIIRKDGEERYIRNNISIIHLYGIEEPVILSVTYDVTVEREANNLLRFLNESAHDILAQEDSKAAINNTLGKLMEYFNAERGYVVEIEKHCRKTNNTYEVCADGVSPQMHNLKGIPFDSSVFWYETLCANKNIVIENINELADEEVRELLISQGVRSLVLAPLWRDDILIGFIGVDNPTRSLNHLDSMTALSDYIAILLTRRDLKRRIELLTNSIPGGLATMICSPERDELAYYNEGFIELMGLEHEKNKITVSLLRSHISEEDKIKIDNLIKQMKEGSDSIEIIYCIHTDDGGYKWINHKATVVERTDDTIVVSGVYIDVTEQQEEKEALRKSDELNRQQYEREIQLRAEIMKNAVSYYQVNLTKGIIEDYHNIYNTISIQDGTPISESLRDIILSSVVDEDKEKVRKNVFSDALMNSYKRGVSSVSIIFRTISPTKNLYWTQCTATIFERYYTQEIVAMIFNQDVDRRKKNEIALNDTVNEEVEYAAVVDVKSAMARFIQISNTKFHFSVDEDISYNTAVSDQLRKYVYKTDMKACEEFFCLSRLADNLNVGETAKLYFRVESNGQIKHKKVKAFLLDNTRREIVFVCRDVTDIYEEEQRQKQVLQKAVDEATRANKAKSEFLSHMSHDMRTPLNAILSYSNEDILQNPKDGQYEDYFKKIHMAGEHLLGLINDILDVSKIEQNSIELNLAPYPTAELMKIIKTTFSKICEAKRIVFTVNIDDKVPRCVLTDKIRLNQVIINIMSNAVKFTRPEGQVEFSVTTAEIKDERKELIFRISDTGVGIDEKFLPFIFDNFAQENNTLISDGEGVGLGLPIAKKLIEIMGGTISFESKAGIGTTFIIKLPVKEVNEKKESKKKETEQYDFNGIRVLICEDNELNANIVKMLLESRGGIVEWAENGQIGVSMFEESAVNYYQAIIMDIRMPVMDGYTATRMMRKLLREDAKTIPIIALTADAFLSDVETSMNAGMNAHLAKPLDTKLMFKTLNRLIKEEKRG